VNSTTALRAVLADELHDADDFQALLESVLRDESDPLPLAGFLGALEVRGVSAAALVGMARALRERMLPFEHPFEDAVDTAGTGGDGLGLVNLSTAAALTAAACGARVVKHGNRAVSSRSGSADFLEALGIDTGASAERARACLEECGFVFLLAPNHHPTLARVADVRRRLGVPTVFNQLGPLLNPGRVRRQWVGVARPERVAITAEALDQLGTQRGAVVHGAGGADELTLCGAPRLAVVGDLAPMGIKLEALGVDSAPIEALRGGSAADNARLLGATFAGEGGPLSEAVALNAALTLLVAGRCEGLADGLAGAREALASGSVAALVERLARRSRGRVA
jgi:anthranilate phosphoribosyltransferase